MVEDLSVDDLTVGGDLSSAATKGVSADPAKVAKLTAELERRGLVAHAADLDQPALYRRRARHADAGRLFGDQGRRQVRHLALSRPASGDRRLDRRVHRQHGHADQVRGRLADQAIRRASAGIISAKSRPSAC
ncbi:hypothetical protein ACRAWD_24485 [Caulobacter segnis]